MNNNNLSQYSLKCQNHMDVQATNFCLSPKCNQNRLFCYNCLNNFHSYHGDLIQPISQLTSYLDSKSLQADEFLKYYFNQFKTLQQTFNRTIKALQYTFGKFSNELLQLDQIQIISLLHQLINFDSFNQFLKEQVVDKLQKMNEIQSQVLQILPLQQIAYRVPAQELAKYKQCGLQLMNQSLYGLAITQFDKILERNPYNIEVQLKKGECLIKQNFYYEAQNQFEEILYLNPHNLEALCGIGNCLLKCNKYDEALIRFQMCLNMNSNNYMALLGLADSLRKQNKLQEAMIQYDKALKVNQQGYAAFYGKAECLKLLNDLNNSENMYWEALQIMENYFDSLFGLADCLKRQKKYQKAIPYYDKSLEISPQHPELLEGKASCLRYCGNNTEAVQFYQAALQQDPSSADALKGLGSSLQLLGRYDESLATFEKALDFDSCSSVSYRGKANCYRKLGKWEDALKYYELALKYDPFEGQANAYKLGLKVLMEQLQESGQNLQMNPQNNINNNQAYCLKLLNDYEGAEKYYAQAASRNPNNYRAHTGYGLCLGERNKYSEAEIQYDKALNINQSAKDALWGKGECLRLQLKFEEALIYYKKSLNIDITHYLSQYILGENSRMNSDFQIAQKYYEMAIQKSQNRLCFLQNQGQSDCFLENLCIQNIQGLSIYGKSMNLVVIQACCLIALNKFQEAFELLFKPQGFAFKNQYVENTKQVLFIIQILKIIVVLNQQ